MLDMNENRFAGHVLSQGKLQDLQRMSLYMNNLGDNSTIDLSL